MIDSNGSGVARLKTMLERYGVEIVVSKSRFLAGNDDYPRVELQFAEKDFVLYVDDEYDDFKIGNPLLDLCLVLREIEYYNSTYDFSLWCKERQLDMANNEVLQYYRDLADINRELYKIIGEVDPFVTDYEFEFNCGAALELRDYSKD